MFRKEWQKVVAIIGIVILFGMILLTAYHFVREPEVVNIEDTPASEEKPTQKFENLSSLSEEDISMMAEDKRIELRDYLASVPAYNVSEAFEGFTSEDDQEYMAIGSSYLEQLHELITDDFYNEIFEQLETGTMRPTVAVPEPLYIAKTNIFDSYLFKSAISLGEYNQEELILKKATDDQIDMVENLRYCREDAPDVCMRNDSYAYVLQYERGDYRISKIR
ncbi:MAG: hypothetical protein IJ772_06160 [Bacilli bacterium]|nr:hypothetical protein [Bacilli bacterium]